MQRQNLAFQRIGGNMQVHPVSFADYPALLELDDAFWAITSLSRHAVRLHPRLLDYLDEDGNGRIQSREIREAIRFMIGHLADGHGVDTASDVLHFDALAPENPDTPKIRAAAEKFLARAGKKDAACISLADLADAAELRANAHFRRGGKIAAGGGGSPEAEKLIAQIADCNGTENVGSDEIGRFVSAAAETAAYRGERRTREKELFPFGDRTAGISGEAESLEACIGAYFLQSETLSFFDSDPDRIGRRELGADPLDAGATRDLLQKVTLAAPRRDGKLDTAGPVNPLYRDKLLLFFSRPETAAFLEDGKLSRDAWQKLLGVLAPYRNWRARRPEKEDFFAGFSDDELDGFAKRRGFDVLDDALRQSMEIQDSPDGFRLLCKLLLLQRHFQEFLRNYVSLADLFDKHRMSLLQFGQLILDARHFSLVTPVYDLAVHKQIAAGSNICVAYIAIDRGSPDAPDVQTLATAITAGDMRRLFVGKIGVFYDPEGREFDAKIIDFIEQPVSFWEALKSPFIRFGKMISSQAGKLFGASSVQKIPALPAAGGATQSVAWLPMLVMGGGVAAIGGSIAFIARTLRSVSIGNIVCAILGILLIFGGPPVFIALVKLFRRDIGRFLEASGCAVNYPMYLSAGLGAFFSWTPRHPAFFIRRNKGARHTFLFAFFLAGILLLAALAFFGLKQMERKNSLSQDDPVEIAQPEPTDTPQEDALR